MWATATPPASRRPGGTARTRWSVWFSIFDFAVLSFEGIKTLSAVLPPLRHRHVLNLDSASAEAVAKAQPQMTSLHVLGLVPLGSVGAEALAKALPHMPSMETLNLYHNSLGDAGATALAEVLPQLRSLKALDLQDNALGDTGAESLAKALQRMTSLQELRLQQFVRR
ncbi:unnamed protein product [Prorocentrum cordatum]|uniref:Uncharacterized protein n=1 Tax=Prorocentrum cordatum TaxID=2364126 RepID=A0ABN9UWV6_9DINO|nr:unnamed protein product [Polarella glacialis]